MASPASSNPTSETYEKYLQNSLVAISEKMQDNNKIFREAVGCCHALIKVEEEGSSFRVTIQSYLEQLGQLTDNQSRILITKWLTLTTLTHFRWDDTLVIQTLDDIAKKFKETFLISYNLHCQMKDKLDQLPDTYLKTVWTMLLVELMNKYDYMSDAEALKGLRREIEIRVQLKQPNLHQPE